MLFDFIDKTLLDLFERFSHRFQDWFGKDNFWLARVTLLLFLLCCFFQWIFTLSGFPVVPIIDGVLLAVMYIKIRDGEMFVGFSGRSAIRNSFAICPCCRGQRFIFLFIWLIVTGLSFRLVLKFGIEWVSILLFVSHSLKWFCVVAVFYLAACTPKPPGKSKVRKFVEVIGKKLRDMIPSPEPAPAPA